MDKKSLRATYKSKRQQLSNQEIENLSLLIANQLLPLDIWNAKLYHLFLSIDKHKEVQTQFILHILQGKDKNVVVSKSDFKDYGMRHFLLTDDTRLQVNAYGIPEPDIQGIEINAAQLDVVFVPLLVCDKQGNRVGYGKGFYDRFLNKCRPDTLKIGLSFYAPIEERIAADSNDIPLDMLVTPDAVFYFNDKMS